MIFVHSKDDILAHVANLFLVLCRPYLDFEMLEGFKLFEFLVGMAAAVYLWRVLTEDKK